MQRHWQDRRTRYVITAHQYHHHYHHHLFTCFLKTETRTAQAQFIKSAKPKQADSVTEKAETRGTYKPYLPLNGSIDRGKRVKDFSGPATFRGGSAIAQNYTCYMLTTKLII